MKNHKADNSKWVNRGYSHETDKIRKTNYKEIPKEIIIWSINDLF